MNKAKKIKMLEEIMELEEGTLQEETVLQSLEEWDSLALLSFVALLDEEFHKNVTGKAVRACRTVAELMAMMEK